MTPEEIEAVNKRYFGSFPRIELNRVKLREVRNEDAPAYFEYIMHPEVAKFVPVDCWQTSVESAEIHLKYWRNNFIHESGICWTLADIKTDKMIGSVTLTRLMPIQRKATLSYDLNYDYWGQGLMTEALEAVMKFCDKNLDLLRVYACAAVTNERSRKLLYHLGFKHEGVMPKYDVLEWKHLDFDSFGRVR
jgi:[ribosomal protein S5]-alanine N-acetyltransferase